MRSESSRVEGLMGVAESRIGDEKSLLFFNPLGELLGTELLKLVTCSLGHGKSPIKMRNRCRIAARRHGSVLDQFVSVDDHITKEGQQFGGTIFSNREIEQVRCLVDESSRTVAVNKG